MKITVSIHYKIPPVLSKIAQYLHEERKNGCDHTRTRAESEETSLDNLKNLVNSVSKRR